VKKILFLAVLDLILFVLAASAQGTVGPIISEYSGKARGEFTVQNQSLTPMTVVLEPMSFSADASGNATFRPLDSNIHVRLDSMSARIGVRQQRTFSYEVNCEAFPCWLSIYTTFTGARTTEGLQIALHIPHTIYFCSKGTKGCRTKVHHEVFGMKD